MCPLPMVYTVEAGICRKARPGHLVRTQCPLHVATGALESGFPKGA